MQASGTFTSAFVVTGGIAVLGALGVAIFVRQPHAETAEAASMASVSSRAQML